MRKAFLLILCLLVCTPTVGAQGRAPQPSPPSPALQQLRDAIRTMTPEQRDWLRTKIEEHRARARVRELEASLLERARAQRAVPAPEQRPLHWLSWPSVVDQPVGPIPTLSDLPAGEYGGSAVTLNGLVSNVELWSKADEAKFNRSIKDTPRIVDSLGQGIEELNRINRPLPSASAASAPSVRNTEDVTALAAAHRQPDIRRVDTANLSGRATVRSNPGGYMVGSVYEGDNFRIGDQFRVKAHKKSKGCWLLGDVVGSPHLRNVWIDCDDLSGKDRANRRATDAEVPDPSESEADLGRRFASIVLPSTDCSNIRDSKYLTDVKRDIAPDKLKLYGNYNPITQQLTDEVTSIVPANVVKVRYLSDDHLAAEVHYVVKDALGNRLSQWGFVSSEILALPLRKDTTPCLNRTP